MRTCAKCKETKPLNEYYSSKDCKGGRRGTCKTCELARQAEYHAKSEIKARRAEYRAERYSVTRDKEIAQSLEYQAANPHIGWEARFRYRARQYGFDPVIESFTRDELIARWGDACVHCGGAFEQLDHAVIPVRDGGVHSLENCRPSCLHCNAGRNQYHNTEREETA